MKTQVMVILMLPGFCCINLWERPILIGCSDQCSMQDITVWHSLPESIHRKLLIPVFKIELCNVW